jgi:hypothetical protein
MTHDVKLSSVWNRAGMPGVALQDALDSSAPARFVGSCPWNPRSQKRGRYVLRPECLRSAVATQNLINGVVMTMLGNGGSRW